MERTAVAPLLARLGAGAWIAVSAIGCGGEPGIDGAERCWDEADAPVPCERLEDVGELPQTAQAPEDAVTVGGADGPGDALPGPDDLDGLADEAQPVPFDLVPPGDELYGEAQDLKSAPQKASPPGGGAEVAWGRTDHAELRKELPIGRTAGASRYVVMRLGPGDVPNLKIGDIVRAAAEIQVTTRCDVGQVAPGCGYAPHVRMQLLLSGRPDAKSPHGPGTIALSDVKGFDCTKDDHHCVEVIDFSDASRKLEAGSAPGCVAQNSCFVDFVMWAYHPDARSGSRDKLLIGANEGNYLDNGKVEQDRGRVMMVRERQVGPGDKALRVTKATVRKGPIDMYSNGDWKRLYSHTLAGGKDLRKGDAFRLWADVEATSDHRVNLSLLFFLTKNRNDRNGGSVNDTRPLAISEHNGTNCSPGNPCHLRKVAVFQVDHDIKGPVFANIAGSAEVPGPGSAHVTVHDGGFVKSLHYAP